MPPLAVHTHIAKQVADGLRLPALDEERGNLYLGATAPDIRVITRWDRRRTHYFDLHSFDEQSGIEGFFSANPALADAAGVNNRTRAFVSGYLTHLILDEAWIGEIYRPCFGERSPLGGSLRANIMDRALQFSLDSDRRDNDELMMHVLQSIAGTELDIEIDFIDRETLAKWRQVIIDITQQRPDWDRFRERAGRHLREAGFESEDGMLELSESLPELVHETLAYLTADRVDGCLRGALDGSMRAVKDYLSCA